MNGRLKMPFALIFAIGGIRAIFSELYSSQIEEPPLFLTYEKAIESAVQGQVDGAVVDALRMELLRVERTADASVRVDVMINLGVALLQQGNAAAQPVFSNLYKEAEQILLAALKLRPNHHLAELNLASVRKNQRLRMSSEPAHLPSKLPDVTTLSYQQAVAMAAQGVMDEVVLEAMRREHAAAGPSASPSRRVDVCINLGVLLLQRGNAAADPRDFAALYREADDLFSAALVLHPAHDLAARNLAAVRRNVLLRNPPGTEDGPVLPASPPMPPSAGHSDSKEFPVADRPACERAADGGAIDQPACGGGSPPEPRRGGVVASLSTIPPRMDSDLRLALDSLLPQVDPPPPSPRILNGLQQAVEFIGRQTPSSA